MLILSGWIWQWEHQQCWLCGDSSGCTGHAPFLLQSAVQCSGARGQGGGMYKHCLRDRESFIDEIWWKSLNFVYTRQYYHKSWRYFSKLMTMLMFLMFNVLLFLGWTSTAGYCIRWG